MLIQLIIIQVVTFFAIVLVLRKFLYAETENETKRLRALREENSVREKELANKIKMAEGAYQEKIAKAEESVKELKAAAEKEIDALRQGVTGKAKEEADRIVSAAVNAKDKMRDEALNEVQAKSPVLATRIFKEFLSSKVKVMTHRELLTEVVSELKKAEKGQFTNVKAKKGELVTAIALAKNERNDVLSAIQQKVGQKIPFDEKEDKNLVAGIVIKLGNVVIDGSLENRLRQLNEK